MKERRKVEEQEEIGINQNRVKERKKERKERSKKDRLQMIGG